jgi:DNA-damage-inducible protein D
MGSIVPSNAPGTSPFDRIKQIKANGEEFWSARALQPYMGYVKWQNMLSAVNRARQAASNTGMDLTSNFTEVSKVSASRGPASIDYELSRQAAYLVAMNGDPDKPEVAAAQAYFAIRTMQAEAAEDALPEWARRDIAIIRQVGRIEMEQQLQAERIQSLDARMGSIEGAYGEFTALGFAKNNGLPTDRVFCQRLGARATRIMRAQGVEPRKREDATFGAINVYPLWALEEATG